MRSIVKVAGAVVASALIVGWLAAPSVIKFAVHKRYPDVGFEKVSLGLTRVYFSEVTFDRGWVKGSLSSVVVSFGSHVYVEGGDVSVNLDAKPSVSGAGEAHDIAFHGLTVHVTKGKTFATLTGVQSNTSTMPWTVLGLSDNGPVPASVFCWESASAHHPRVSAEISSGCAEKDGSKTSVYSGTFTMTGVPFLMEGAPNGFKGLFYRDKVVMVDDIDLSTRDPHGDPFRTTASEIGIWDLDTSPVLRASEVTVRHLMLRSDPEVKFKTLPVTFKDVEVHQDGPGMYGLSVEGLKLAVDVAHMSISGKDDCQTWVNALPEGLRSSPLPALKFEGPPFDFKLTLRPAVTITATSCKVTTCDPILALRKSFTYTTYDVDHHPVPRTTGPDTPHWTKAEDASAVPMAAVNTEDYMFRQHKGFIPAALTQSLLADVQAGRFVRGGSTIEMQLAKNIWLDRTKTLGRKAQELFLAMALDSCLTKDQILETYLNVVEFGPGVYGIYDGAHYWFKKDPAELTATESFWLATILPHPEKAGEPTPAALRGAESVMRMLSKEGRIPMLADTVPDDTDGWVFNQ